MQIRSRLTIQFSLMVGSILLTSFVLIYSLAYRFNKQEFHQRLNDKAVTTATLLLRVQEVDASLLKTIDRAKRDALFGENITVYDQSNQEIYTNNDTINFNINPSMLEDIREHRRVNIEVNRVVVCIDLLIGLVIDGDVFPKKGIAFSTVNGLKERGVDLLNPQQ